MLDILSDIRSTFIVVIITTYEKYVRTGLEYGAVSFIDKPILTENFLRGINLGLRRVAEMNDEKERLRAEIIAELESAASANTPTKTDTKPDVQEQTQAPATILLRQDGYEYAIPLASLLYIKADNHHVTFHTEDGQKYSKRAALTDYEKYLNDWGLIKPHRRYLVALKHIKKSDREFLYVGTSEQQIPLSKANIAAVKAAQMMVREKS
ncbi:MAG: LytR/AlgR family response regulator transcription factor [Candidatus Kapaibacteriota bacterium]|jgi:DNA-binding LytR/AlgR family response regulator